MAFYELLRAPFWAPLSSNFACRSGAGAVTVNLPRGRLWAPTGSILRAPLKQARLSQWGEHRHPDTPSWPSMGSHGLHSAHPSHAALRLSQRGEHRSCTCNVCVKDNGSGTFIHVI